MADKNIRNFVFGVFLLAILIFFGTYAFSTIEGVDPFNSLYNIVLIITTVGTQYNITTFYGKILVIGLLAFGFGLGEMTRYEIIGGSSKKYRLSF